MGLIVLVLALVLLVCCWAVGDMEGRTKIIITLVYLATWLLVFVNGLAVTAAQAIFCLVVGTMTFGASWWKR